MPTPKHFLAARGDECVCGRRKSLRHCIVCGSARTYARQRRMHKCLDGIERHVELQFRCQGCGHVFIEEEREFCEAPPVGQALLTQKLRAVAEAQKLGQPLRANDAKLAGALGELIAPTSPEDSAKARKLLIYRLTVEYIDTKLYKQQLGESFDDSLQDFTIRRMREMGVPERELETLIIHSPTEAFVQEVDSERGDPEQAHKVIVSELRMEWARKKLAGRQPTKTVDEYVERRLAGEIFE